MSEKNGRLDEEVIDKVMKWLEKEDQKVEASTEEPAGVLLASEIIKLCSGESPLIENLPNDFEELKRRIKPAAIHLSLGKICKVGGKTVVLTEERPFLKIEPYQVAIVETKEKLNMPKNLIGRWNLRISAVYKGLLWVGGPQVDPWYKGPLYCPLYNLSTEAVTLEYGEPFATIDFVRTTPGYSRKLDQTRFKAGDYPRFESAPSNYTSNLKSTKRTPNSPMKFLKCLRTKIRT